MTLFGFYFLLVFVFATIPAGIYGTFYFFSPISSNLKPFIFRSPNPKLQILSVYHIIHLFAAKRVYETSLANVDYLHGSAEFLLTLTNLFIVMGLRKAIREAESENASKAAAEGSKASSK